MFIAYQKINHYSLMTVILALWLVFGQVRIGHTHDVAGPIDPAGNVPGFTAVAMVTCFDDGNGTADHLIANITDLSFNPPVEGLFVTLTLFKGGSAISATDIAPGSADPSPTIRLRGGEGVYFMIINKTKLGVRNVGIDYHCMTEDDVHTGTDIVITNYE